MTKPRSHTVLFLILTGITFSPLIISPNMIEPRFLGMPRTLWAGILISICFLLLTLVAAIRLAREDKLKKMD